MIGTVTSRPNFNRPPILEQAITVAFERITDFDAVDFGLFWSTIRQNFPNANTTPKAPVFVESFDSAPVTDNMRLILPVELPRSMFRNDSGELVQLQDDRFGFNWIKVGEASPYPRYDATRKRFLKLYEQFANYIRERYQVDLELRQCEITNVNIILVSAFGKDFADMNAAFNVDAFDLGIVGVVPETYSRQRQYLINDESDAPLGRLHLTINPVFRVGDLEPAFKFELTARSGPTIATISDALNFFDRAHDVINAAFMATVTPRMCELWEQVDGE
jgi:uncharacterized protein (TIGR04255 family)